jgi:hypothetical protein
VHLCRTDTNEEKERNMTEEEWTVVTSQDKRRVMRAGRTRRRPVAPQVDTTPNEWTQDIESAVLDTISKCRQHLLSTEFYQNFKAVWTKSSHKVEQIVCYGIGNLSTSSSASMWQLACALTIRNFLQKGDESIPLLFYDPCTTPSEAFLLRSKWNIQVLSENERGKRLVHGVSTLFFMPHCPLRLYDNVLWANWDMLDKVVLFGNSLHAYSERTIGKLPAGVSCLLPLLTEEGIHLTKRDVEHADGNLEGAFNDCYLSWLSMDEETVLPPRPEETLQDDNEEVI